MREGLASRRWLPVSLRAILVAIPVASVIFLGFYSLNWIRQRHEPLTGDNKLLAKNGFAAWNEYDESGAEVARPPWSLGLLGEPGYLNISIGFQDDFRFRLNNGVSPSDEDEVLKDDERQYLERIRRLFPEADVRAYIGTLPGPLFINTDGQMPLGTRGD